MLALEGKLAEAWPPADWADVTVVVAVSGGCDSVALLRGLTALKTRGQGRLAVAHLNHCLRPEAMEDQRLVVDLCRNLGVACEVGRIDVEALAGTSGDGIEAAARTARYGFLEETARRLGARFVATAHTADDQAETILHRIVRGTGLRGLSGMARARPLGHAILIRPLLETRRHELEEYLHALGQLFRHDPSNADQRFTRNRIRHDTMPRLRHDFNANVSEALLRLGTLAGEAQAVIDGLVDELFTRSVTIESPGAARIDLAPLAGQPRYVLRELLMAVWRRQNWPRQAMGHGKWEQLCDLASSAAPASQTLPAGISATVAEARLELRQP